MIPVLAILGPTASGKSEAAVRLAEELGGEVINADSMQVYRHLRIGTAGPDKKMLARCPHHLFYVLELDEHPDAAWYATHAADVIDQVHARGKLPIVVGGTFFWVKTLFEGIARVPSVPRLDPARFADPYAKLMEIDPKLAARLHPADTQRVMRGIEVYTATGIPLSEYHAMGNIMFGDFRVLKVWLDMDRGLLYRRIHERLDVMLKEGLVQEVRTLLQQGIPADIPAFRSGGYKYVVAHCLGGMSMDEMKEKTDQEHRNYARRQLVWLRREQREGKVERVDAFDFPALRRRVEAWMQRA